MIGVVMWKWRSRDGTREYLPEHVNALKDALRANSTCHELKFHCITDDAVGLDEDIQTHEIPARLLSLPINYRKLWLLSQEAARMIPGRIFFIDLDVLVTGPIDHLLDRQEEIVLWHDSNYPEVRYAGGQYLFNAGCRAWVWESFDPVESPRRLLEYHLAERGRRHTGSDQAYMSFVLDGEATWSTSGDGVYRARHTGETLPAGACLVHFPGKDKPWHPRALTRWPWAKQFIPSRLSASNGTAGAHSTALST